jgi:translin
MLPIKMMLREQLRLAIREMEELNEVREEAIRNSRRWISIARNSILESREFRNLRNVEKTLLESLRDVREFIGELKSKPGFSELAASVVQDAVQELVEGIVLCKIVMGEEVPNHIELGVGAREYLLGVSDVVGELRRIALHYLKEGNVRGAEELVEIMEEIYEGINSAVFPDSLIPLRRKVDEARIMIEKTISEIIFVKSSRRDGIEGR